MVPESIPQSVLATFATCTFLLGDWRSPSVLFPEGIDYPQDQRYWIAVVVFARGSPLTRKGTTFFYSIPLRLKKIQEATNSFDSSKYVLSINSAYRSP